MAWRLFIYSLNCRAKGIFLSCSMLSGDYWDFLPDSKLSHPHFPKSKYFMWIVVIQQWYSKCSLEEKRKESPLHQTRLCTYLSELINLEALHLLSLCQGCPQQAFLRQSSQHRAIAVREKENTLVFIATITSSSCFSFKLFLKCLSSLGIFS